MIRENFTGISSSLLNTLINNAPSVAFLDQKKVCKMKRRLASFVFNCLLTFYFFDFFIPLCDKLWLRPMEKRFP